MTKITSALIFLFLGFGPAHAIEPFVVLQKNSDSSYASSEKYRVRRGDTLAKIVAQFYPNVTGRAALFQQIVSDNPHAFLRMNPNKLLAGKVLRMPAIGGMVLDRSDDIYFF